MNFEQANAFWLLLLLLVPIIIHLFQFRRYKKLAFSNVAFLKKVTESKKQHSRLKHLLILLSRCLFIIFLVTCLAQPFLKDDTRKFSSQLLVLDHSPSMAQLAEGKNTLVIDEMIQRFNELSESYPDFKPDLIDGLGENFQLFEKAQINGSQTGIDLKKLLSLYPASKQLIIASDFQKNNFDPYMSVFSDTSKQFILMPAYQKMPETLVFDSLWLGRGGEVQRQDLLLEAYHSSEEDRTLAVKLNINDQSAGTSQVKFSGGGSSRINFTLSRIKAGANSINFQVEEASLFDDAFYAVINNFDQLKVLYLFDGAEKKQISALFNGQADFELESRREANFNYQNLDVFDAILLEMGDGLSSSKAKILDSFVESGKTLVLMPQANKLDPVIYNEFGFTVNKLNSNDEKVKLLTPDYDNPFFEGVFKEKNKNIQMPEVSLAYAASGGNAIFTAANGLPFLLSKKKIGSIFLFTSPFEKDAKGFMASPLLLPTFYKMVFSQSKDRAVDYYYLDQDLIALNYLDLPSNTLVKLEKADVSIVPDQRNGVNGFQLILPKNILDPGIWEIKDHQTDELYGLIGLNYPKEESVASYFTAEELKAKFKDQGNVIVLDDMELKTIKSFIDKSKAGFPLWKYFLVLALLSLLAEVLIIRFLK